METAWAYNEPDVYRKLQICRDSENLVLNLKSKVQAPEIPARNVTVLHPKQHPAKIGLSTKPGQARMLHDLASIELQAMELGLRTLSEFPEAPAEFKQQLWQITLSEADHLEMCLLEIEKLGFKFGDWPVHCALWRATSNEDSLLDRILIVHRYLEGSGLDAGDTLLNRLVAVDAKTVRLAAERIFSEEVGHVQFGSDWYRRIAALEKIDPNQDYFTRMNRLRYQLPKRVENICAPLRLKAGFTEAEIEYLKELREWFLAGRSVGITNTEILLCTN